MSQLEVIRTCALLHDIGKLECWAQREKLTEHTRYTYNFVRKCLGETLAEHARRHHIEPFYPEEDKPANEIEQILCLANNLAAGSERERKSIDSISSPSLPIKLTHVFSNKVIRNELDESKLTSLSQALAKKLEGLEKDFSENPKQCYSKIFDILEESGLHLVPAEANEPMNDVSLWNHLKLTAAFATCIYLEGGWRGYNLQDYKFALLSGDADKISSFVSRSLRLPDLNARSKLIIKAIDKVREFLKDFLGPECIVFAAGGSFLAFCPPRLVNAALEGAKKSFETVSDGKISITVSHVITSGDELRMDFGKVWKESQRRMRLEKSKRLLVPEVAVDEEAEVCDVCRRRAWVREYKHRILRIDASPRPERLCDFCWKLREEGKGVWLNDLKDKSNFVACIKADGDDVGRVLTGKIFDELGKASTPSRIETLSDIIHRTCEREFRGVIKKFSKRESVVYAGGDDLLAFVPGEAALKASKEIALKFREEMANKCTLSAGVAIFHYRLPVYVGVEAAGYLLSRAKEEGKNRIAFAVIGGSGVTLSELKRVEPRRWDELDVILETVDFMRGSGVASSQLRRIANVAMDDPEKAEVLIKYLMGREIVDWNEGVKFLLYLKSGLLREAFLVYNLFRGVVYV